MIVSAVNNNSISFKGRFPKLNGQFSDVPIVIKGEASYRYTSVTDVFRKIHRMLNTLSSQSASDDAQYIFMELQERFGIKSVSKKMSEGIALKNGDNDLLVSLHGEESIRFRDRDTKTGEITDSFFCSNKKLVKSDTRYEIPENLEFYHYDEYKAGTHLADFMKRFDFVDSLFLKLRIALDKPEVQKELNTKSAADIIADYNKLNLKKQNLTVNEISGETQEKPKKILSYYEKLLMASKQSKEQKAKETVIKQEVKNIPPKSEKEEIKTEKPKKVGRPRKNPPKPVESPKRILTSKYDKGIVGQNKLEMFEDIYDEFVKVYEQLHSIQNSVTRNKTKNGYGEKLAKGCAGSRELNFIGIGKNGENYSVNILNYNYEKSLVIKITKKGMPEQYYILNSQNQLMKTPPLMLKFGKQKNDAAHRVEYYSQEEIDLLNTDKILSPLRFELREYNDYISNKINKISEKKNYYTNANGFGNLNDEHDKLQEISVLYNEYRDNFRKIYTKKRHKFTEIIKFDITKNSDIIMRDIGAKGEAIRLSYPHYEGKKVMMLQVLGQNDNVKNNFYIIDDKLVKFDSDSLYTRKHGKRGIYYHSQEYIEKSDVRYYINEVKKRLEYAKEVYGEIKQTRLEDDFGTMFRKTKNEFLRDIQNVIADFQSDITKTRHQTNDNITRLTRKTFYEIKQNTIKSLEDLKKKLEQMLESQN